MAKRDTMEVVAVAVDKDRGSQHALKWTAENLVSKGQIVTLLHITQKQISDSDRETLSKELFLPFKCFLTRKEIDCNEVILEGVDVPNAINEYALANAVSTLVLGAASKTGLARKITAKDVSTTVSKSAPEFCSVYIINKGKIASVRPATGPVPEKLTQQLQRTSSTVNRRSGESAASYRSKPAESESAASYRSKPAESESYTSNKSTGEVEMRSALNGRRGYTGQSEMSMGDYTDTSAVSSGRHSSVRDRQSNYENNMTVGRFSNNSEYDNRSYASSDYNSSNIESSSLSQSSFSGQSMDNLDFEMKRLRLELKKTMDYYNESCKEAAIAKEKATEIQRRNVGGQKIEQARLIQEAAMEVAEREKANCKVALEAAALAQKIAELESQKRKNAERKMLQQIEDSQKAGGHVDLRYRRYSIEEIEEATEYFADSRKIGEGGYGPVYKCNLDHTPVAIKVLRPDAAQGRSQFNQEVEVLSSIRHPNMVLLLGACPEYGCLVYEHMARGSLEDQLFPRGNTPVLSWQQRFRISAEIATGLLFLHQTKPEPLVHRDLKPGNILLDSNYVSKISDVGLARLVPPTVADSVTQYHMTSAAGTFCYIDPEYQQTGMLGVKSDVYSLGIMLLQIITARPPMGLTHQVENSIENGTFAKVLDPAVPDWPIEAALTFAKLALKCAELRRKDRPDLGKVVLPELRRLSALGEETMPNINYRSTPTRSQVSASSNQNRTSDSGTSRGRSATPTSSNSRRGTPSHSNEGSTQNYSNRGSRPSRR